MGVKLELEESLTGSIRADGLQATAKQWDLWVRLGPQATPSLDMLERKDIGAEEVPPTMRYIPSNLKVPGVCNLDKRSTPISGTATAGSERRSQTMTELVSGTV